MITYSFKIVKVDKPSKVMEIEYSAPGHQTVIIGARLPYLGESLDSIVAMYAPIRYWEEQDLEVEDIVQGIYGYIEPAATSETPEDRKRQYIDAIQLRLDAFASTRGYDGILSACTYATSTNTKFAVEGQRAVELRDATWAAAYGLFDRVTSGETLEPASFEEIAQYLPELTWTD